jgi:predicted signal transduction protein with EAL and GGDEF domain
LEGVTVDVSGSIGVALYPAHSQDAQELFKNSDTAMYIAKRGRLGTQMFNPDSIDVAPMSDLTELRSAVEGGELLLR